MASLDIGDDRVREEADNDDRDGAKEQPASCDEKEDDQDARHIELRPFEPFPAGERPSRGEEDRGAGGDEEQEREREALREDAKHARMRQVSQREQESVGSAGHAARTEEHTSELQSLMSNSYAVFCLKKKNKQYIKGTTG